MKLWIPLLAGTAAYILYDVNRKTSPSDLRYQRDLIISHRELSNAKSWDKIPDMYDDIARRAGGYLNSLQIFTPEQIWGTKNYQRAPENLFPKSLLK